ncbi:MAG TPA: hypothetical protein VFS20_02055 [Longimicrobium sp.]|nr:hypothetical protein [Longimicrobium sp.]
MITLFSQLVLLVAVAGCAAGAAWALTRTPLAGGALILAVYVAEAFAVVLPGFRVGLYVYPQDVVFVLLLVSAGIRLSRGVNALQLLLLAYAALVLGSFMRGVQQFGVQPAGVDVRTFVYFAAGALYFSTFEIGPAVQRALVRMVLAAAAVLLALAVFRWIATALDLAIVEQWASITTNRMRVLHSGHALFLSQCGLLAFALQLARTGKGRYLAGPLFAAVLLLQHRTVWAQVLVVAAFGILFSGRLRGRLMWRATAISLIAGAFAVSLFGSQLETLAESLRASATGDETWTWRVQGWQVLLGRFFASDAVTQILGAPFGSGYVRYLGMHRITVSPHNFYVQNLLRVGFAGLALFAGVYLLLILRISRAGGNVAAQWLRPGLVQLLMVSQLLYFITYSPGFEQCLFLGLAFGYLRALERPRARPAPAATRASRTPWVRAPRLVSRPY